MMFLLLWLNGLKINDNIIKTNKGQLLDIEIDWIKETNHMYTKDSQKMKIDV